MLHLFLHFHISKNSPFISSAAFIFFDVYRQLNDVDMENLREFRHFKLMSLTCAILIIPAILCLVDVTGTMASLFNSIILSGFATAFMLANVALWLVSPAVIVVLYIVVVVFSANKNRLIRSSLHRATDMGNYGKSAFHHWTMSKRLRGRGPRNTTLRWACNGWKHIEDAIAVIIVRLHFLFQGNSADGQEQKIYSPLPSLKFWQNNVWKNMNAPMQRQGGRVAFSFNLDAKVLMEEHFSEERQDFVVGDDINIPSAIAAMKRDASTRIEIETGKYSLESIFKEMINRVGAAPEALEGPASHSLQQLELYDADFHLRAKAKADSFRTNEIAVNERDAIRIILKRTTNLKEFDLRADEDYVSLFTEQTEDYFAFSRDRSEVINAFVSIFHFVWDHYHPLGKPLTAEERKHINAELNVWIKTVDWVNISSPDDDGIMDSFVNWLTEFVSEVTRSRRDQVVAKVGGPDDFTGEDVDVDNFTAEALVEMMRSDDGIYDDSNSDDSFLRSFRKRYVC